MLRVKHGDREAFSVLVANYKNRLIGVFTHLLQDHNAAEDLAQEVFLRIYKSRKRYQPTANFSSWLFRIANNLASNVWRSRRIRKEVPLEIHPRIPSVEQSLVDPSDTIPCQQMENGELGDVVRYALSTLNERQRTAIVLHNYEGMPYAEIGLAMQTTVPAVKALVFRAKRNLRDVLEHHLHQ
ncbi:MAG: sigma-70 family RNA polymerase sigma factor [Planctomycetaceae bacterium]|nr:sigma-70 family RNA polymerase sigma factor [Planctomycetaceae bacterium]